MSFRTIAKTILLNLYNGEVPAVLNTHMVCRDGTVIYPEYMEDAERLSLRQKIGDDKEFIYCGCRSTHRIYYRISSDLRFIPCRNGLAHAPDCFRYDENAVRLSSYIHRNGKSVAYLSFKPDNFSVKIKKVADDFTPENSSEDSEETVSAESPKAVKDDTKAQSEKKKEPTASLAKLVQMLNYDAYMTRLGAGKSVLSADYFTNVVIGHFANVIISPMNITIKELNAQKGGFSFFYGRLVDYTEKDISFDVTISMFGRDRKYFVFNGIWEGAMKKFSAAYGNMPVPSEGNVMISGFIYRRRSRMGNEYFTPGRIHLFKVSQNGIYAASDALAGTFNRIFTTLRNRRLFSALKVFLPSDEPNVICRLVGNGKTVVVCENLPFAVDENMLAVGCCGQELSENSMTDILSYFGWK